MKKPVAVFGGVFDPPHNGHREVISWTLENTRVEELIVMPCGTHRIKRKICTSASHRMEMAGLAFDSMKKVTVSGLDIELSAKCRPGPEACLNKALGSTWELLALVQKKRKEDAEVCFVLGQDNAETISSWYRWEDLLRTYPFIILPRDGITPMGKWYSGPPHVFADGFPPRAISSTEIRNGQKLEWLQAPVAEYIFKYGLYGITIK